MRFSLVQINHLNSALIVGVFALAWYFPFQLFFFSYAFLGPAHYLTQISWLHDRHYFVPYPRLTFWALFLATALMFCVPPPFAILAILLALLVAAFAVMYRPTEAPSLALWACSLVLICAAVMQPSALFLVLLLPTVLHVFVFTGSFMLAGALKNSEARRSALISTVLFFGLGLSFFLLPAQWFAARFDPQAFPLHHFDEIAIYLGQLTGVSLTVENTANFFAFLSFAYTYHYLNWFSKVEVLRWHKISNDRKLLLLVIYITVTAAYLDNYTTGFMLVLFLSLLHVFLELPLNVRTFGLLLAHAKH